MITEQRSSSLNYEVISKGRKTSNRRASLGSALDFHSLFSTPRRSTEYEVPRRSSGKIAREYPMHIEDAIEKPNELLEELLKCLIDLSFLTYKQKFAFWINIYNACIMNVLSQKGPMDEKEVLLRHAYGLGYPEPNVTFALCRGTWSSPALRVYTSDDVVNQLGRAKVEYLEASVGITSKRKILVPKLLEWHKHDFADEMESLLEWIYCQLPRSGSLKRATMECLIKETKISSVQNGGNPAI
ncbi:hypothetical protein D0Y65_004994 [Glycine soja]|uniref:DUF547 domain-containing protein n=1 Tax=Glycine soja TaxID=3848 RepID=A0A445LTS7_GLYSO|nr:hypothetical protein D0Y65_004994 [Glycine soja]